MYMLLVSRGSNSVFGFLTPWIEVGSPNFQPCYSLPHEMWEAVCIHGGFRSRICMTYCTSFFAKAIAWIPVKCYRNITWDNAHCKKGDGWLCPTPQTWFTASVPKVSFIMERNKNLKTGVPRGACLAVGLVTLTYFSRSHRLKPEIWFWSL